MALVTIRENEIGLGNVVGPGSAIDNGIVRWDQTSGRLVQSSNLTVGDSGMMTWTVAGEAITAGSYQAGRNADATNRYQINVPASAFVEISSNDVGIMFFSTNGTSMTGFLGDSVASGNGYYDPSATNGNLLNHNIADSVQALLVRQENAGSTGPIAVFANSGGTAFTIGLNGGLSWSLDSSIVAAQHEIRRTASGLNLNTVTGDSILMGVNGGTTFSVGEGSMAYTATANEAFTITANSHTGTSGVIDMGVTLGADDVSAININASLGGNFSAFVTDITLTAHADGSDGAFNVVHAVQIVGDGSDANQTQYVGFRAEEFTSNGGSNTGIGFSVGTGFNIALGADSGALYGVDNSSWGIIALNTEGSNRAGYGIAITADDGFDSGATARDGGSVNVKLGAPANAGTTGKFNIIESGAGTDALSLWHDGSHAQYSTNVGEHRFGQKINVGQGGIRMMLSTANVTAVAPTDAELDSAFGDPTTVGSGFTAVVDDNGDGTACFLVYTTGTAGEWFWVAGTKAL